MKFVRFEVVSGVAYAYDINEGDVFYVVENTLFRLGVDGVPEKVAIINIEFIRKLIVADGKILIIGSKCVCIVDPVSKEVFNYKVPVGTGSLNFMKDVFAPLNVHFDPYENTRLQGMFNFMENEILWKANLNEILSVSGDSIYAVTENYISELSFESGSVIWRYEFDERLGYFPKIYFANKNIVIYGKSIESGLQMIDGLNSSVVWSEDCIGAGMVVDEKNSIIHKIYLVYTQRNLHTGELIKSNVDRDYFDSVRINSIRSNSILEGKYIITTDNNSNGGVAVFDTETMEYVWTYFVDGVTFPPSKPIVYKYPYLLISDNRNQLHIFKRVDDEV